MKLWKPIVILACLSVALGACSALDSIGDKIDAQCELGTGDLTQSYIDPYNDYLAGKGRKFRIDGITCLE